MTEEKEDLTSDEIFEMTDEEQTMAKMFGHNPARVYRQEFADRPTTDFIFPADNTNVRDNKGHFPIPDIEHGRNALARVAQYDVVPTWFKGTLKQLRDKVKSDVKKKYPSIESGD